MHTGSTDMCVFSGGKIFAVNGPSMLGTQEVMVYEVDYTSGELLGAFSPNGEVSASRPDAQDAVQFSLLFILILFFLIICASS